MELFLPPAGNKTMTNFSLQVDNSSWKDFSQAEDISIDIPGASVGALRARFVRREGSGSGGGEVGPNCPYNFLVFCLH